MQFESLTPAGFGLQVTGLDLTTPLTDNQWSVIEAEFHRGGGLLLVRGNPGLSAGQLKAFARKFGPLEDNEKYYRMGLEHQLHSAEHREVLCVGNRLRDKSMMIEVDPAAELLWHCDDSFRAPQPMGSCFYCVEAPADSATGGAATHFASGTAAWRALDGETRARLRRAVAVHDYNALNELLRRENPTRAPLSDEVRALTPPVLRPLAAVHPVTGREALFVPACHMASARHARVDGGAALDVHELLRHATQPEFTYAHHWSAGDCIVWDNRCTLHAPSAFNHARNTRLMYRITMHGEQIAPSPAELEAREASATREGGAAEFHGCSQVFKAGTPGDNGDSMNSRDSRL